MKQIRLKITVNERLRGLNYMLILESLDVPLPGWKPGQFASIRLPENTAYILRRPLSIFQGDTKSLTFIYKVVGKGTELLSTLKPGAMIDCIMPLGNGAGTFFDACDTVIGVAGGIGIAPVYAVLKAALDSGKKGMLAYGAASADDLVLVERCDALSLKDAFYATDDGSEGMRGTAVDSLKNIINKYPDMRHVVVFTCGPQPMLKAVAGECEKRCLPCYVSIENHMGCGVGACLCCVVKSASSEGYKRVCADGPVFRSHEIEL